jgi:hypothetical protein
VPCGLALRHIEAQGTLLHTPLPLYRSDRPPGLSATCSRRVRCQRCPLTSVFSDYSSTIRRPGCSLIAVDPSHHLGFLWPNPQRGKIGSVNAKFEPYVKAGNFLLPAVSIVTPRTMVFVSDPEVIKAVMTDRSGVFQKDPQTYAVLHVYGINIIGPCVSPEFCQQRL